MTFPDAYAQTIDVIRGVWRAADAAIVGTLPVQSYGRRIVLMELLAPKNTTLTIYRGPDIIAGFRALRVFPADARTYDNLMFGSPILVYPGQVWSWAWTGGIASAIPPNDAASCTATSQVF